MQGNLSSIIMNVLEIPGKDYYIIPTVAISQVSSLLDSVQLRIPTEKLMNLSKSRGRHSVSQYPHESLVHQS